MSPVMIRRTAVAALVVLSCLGLWAGPGWSGLAGGLGGARPAAATTGLSVAVAGDRLVDGRGIPLQVVGVNRSGTEYACAQGWGIFDGPSDGASVSAMAAWHTNAVRVPLNEDCWLGINGVNPLYSGAAYRKAIGNYVQLLHGAGLLAILDLHWSAPGTQLALGQQVMADADHAPAFWTSVAAFFQSDPGVIFDLYNEPHDISWSCWRDGCTTAAGWKAAGMQSLLSAVRGAGATQPVLAEGLNWGGDLSQWLAYAPVDPQLAASAHIYNFSQCNTATCWTRTIAPVAERVPVVTGEIGENDCAGAFVAAYMSWADATGVSYLGWSWNTANCASGPALITSYSGAATPFGAAIRDHLAGLAGPQAGYVLDGHGGLDGFNVAGGAGPAAGLDSASWPTSNLARAAGRLDGGGGYVLDGWGGVHPFTTGTNAMPPPATTSDSWPGWDIARAIAVLPDGSGGYVLDGWGGVHPFATGTNPMPPAARTSASWPQQDIARGIVVLRDGTGGYVLDGWGGVHPFAVGTNPMPPAATLSASWPGWDIARSLALLADGSGGYVLDGWGGVHPFSTGTHAMAPAATSSTSWPFQDVARGIAITRAGTAGYVVRQDGAIAFFSTGASGQPATATPAVLPGGSVGRSVVLTP